ncbi:hypothetical protein CAEBREN_20352 [Caenorhabditis brenneri]|uniref:NTF2-like domain-containing protein n=1 Tax=Caenorhabditis brenneri TaxID=135651 RepID=G0P5J8_CAEBE|nr:hypothetical protein CAEBREN_20352 [Caenorhabditis brenneri]
MAPNKVVERALARIGAGIDAKDAARIGAVFQNSFFLRGCKGRYTKDNVIGMLIVTPTEKKRTYVFTKFTEDNRNIYASVQTHAYGGRNILMELVYHKVDEQFASATILDCDQKKSFVQPPPTNDRSNLVVENYLVKMKKAIQEKSEVELNHLFEVDFQFYGCKGVYDRDQVVSILMNFPSDVQMDIDIIYSKWRNWNVDIDYTVVIGGFGPENITADFHLYRAEIGSWWRLSSGRNPSCPSEKLIGKNIKKRSVATEDESLKVVDSYLSLMKSVVYGGKVELIADLFMNSFTFYGCKENYHLADAVRMLQNIPSNVRIRVNSSSFVGAAHIVCNVELSGIESTPIVTEFHLFQDSSVGRGTHWRLSSGKVKNCAHEKKAVNVERSKGSIRGQDPGILMNNFLGTVRQIIANQDSSAFEKIIRNFFMFQGCDSYYNKEDAIKIFPHIPSDTSLTLKSANWNPYSQIENTVIISGANHSDIGVQFIYCPYRKQLMAGSVVSCGGRTRRVAA